MAHVPKSAGNALHHGVVCPACSFVKMTFRQMTFAALKLQRQAVKRAFFLRGASQIAPKHTPCGRHETPARKLSRDRFSSS